MDGDHIRRPVPTGQLNNGPHGSCPNRDRRYEFHAKRGGVGRRTIGRSIDIFNESAAGERKDLGAGCWRLLCRQSVSEQRRWRPLVLGTGHGYAVSRLSVGSRCRRAEFSVIRKRCWGR